MNTQYFLSSDNTFSYAVCAKSLKWRFLLRDGRVKEVSTKNTNDIKRLVPYFNKKQQFAVCTYEQYLTLKK